MAPDDSQTRVADRHFTVARDEASPPYSRLSARKWAVAGLLWAAPGRRSSYASDAARTDFGRSQLLLPLAPVAAVPALDPTVKIIGSGGTVMPLVI